MALKVIIFQPEEKHNKINLYLEGGSKITFHLNSFLNRINYTKNNITAAFTREQFKMSTTYIKGNKQITIENDNKKIQFFEYQLKKFL